MDLNIKKIMFQETQKSQIYFSRDHGFQDTAKMCENQYFPYFDP